MIELCRKLTCSKRVDLHKIVLSCRQTTLKKLLADLITFSRAIM